MPLVFDKMSSDSSRPSDKPVPSCSYLHLSSNKNRCGEVLPVPQTTLRFGTSLGELTGLSARSCLWLQLIKVKGDQTQSAKGDISWIKSGGRESRHRLPESSPSKVIQDVLNALRVIVWDNLCEMLPPGKPQHPGILLGLVTRAPSACRLQIPDSKQEGRGLRNQFRHRKTLMGSENGEHTTKIQVLSQGASSYAGQSKDNSQPC